MGSISCNCFFHDTFSAPLTLLHYVQYTFVWIIFFIVAALGTALTIEDPWKDFFNIFALAPFRETDSENEGKQKSVLQKGALAFCGVSHIFIVYFATIRGVNVTWHVVSAALNISFFFAFLGVGRGISNLNCNLSFLDGWWFHLIMRGVAVNDVLIVSDELSAGSDELNLAFVVQYTFVLLSHCAFFSSTVLDAEIFSWETAADMNSDLLGCHYLRIFGWGYMYLISLTVFEAYVLLVLEKEEWVVWIRTALLVAHILFFITMFIIKNGTKESWLHEKTQFCRSPDNLYKWLFAANVAQVCMVYFTYPGSEALNEACASWDMSNDGPSCFYVQYHWGMMVFYVFSTYVFFRGQNLAFWVRRRRQEEMSTGDDARKQNIELGGIIAEAAKTGTQNDGADDGFLCIHCGKDKSDDDSDLCCNKGPLLCQLSCNNIANCLTCAEFRKNDEDEPRNEAAMFSLGWGWENLFDKLEALLLLIAMMLGNIWIVGINDFDFYNCLDAYLNKEEVQVKKWRRIQGLIGVLSALLELLVLALKIWENEAEWYSLYGALGTYSIIGAQAQYNGNFEALSKAAGEENAILGFDIWFYYIVDTIWNAFIVMFATEKGQETLLSDGADYLTGIIGEKKSAEMNVENISFFFKVLSYCLYTCIYCINHITFDEDNMANNEKAAQQVRSRILRIFSCLIADTCLMIVILWVFTANQVLDKVWSDGTDLVYTLFLVQLFAINVIGVLMTKLQDYVMRETRLKILGFVFMPLLPVIMIILNAFFLENLYEFSTWREFFLVCGCKVLLSISAVFAAGQLFRYSDTSIDHSDNDDEMGCDCCGLSTGNYDNFGWHKGKDST